MKRLNIKDAFVGEPSGVDDGSEEAGDEAVVLAVRGGELVVVVPPGTADERLLDGPSIIRGALRLENEQVLSFEIYDGATGAFFEHESAELHRRRQESGSVGLSSIEGSNFMGTVHKLAREVMSATVVSVAPETPVKELSRLLTFHNISGMPVIEQSGALVGVVSEADVIAKRGITVGEIMTTPVISAGEDASLDVLAQQMARNRVKRILILRGDELVGIVTRADIVRALAGV